MRMEVIFSFKIWGLYRVYLYAEPKRFDTMIHPVGAGTSVLGWGVE